MLSSTVTGYAEDARCVAPVPRHRDGGDAGSFNDLLLAEDGTGRAPLLLRST